MIRLYHHSQTFLSVLLMLVLATASAWGQRVSVSGTVTDSEGITLPGVNVIEKGTTNGTTTDANGKYTLTVSPDAVLRFAFVGMKALEVGIGNRSVVDVSMEYEVSMLDEIVVIGYGTVERRDLTSSVSSVGAKQLKDIPLNSAAEAVTGRLAGVQVTRSEGSPDADFQIRVRGGNTITQDVSPIYVVDGIQVENALSVIAPQDIESIDVLKDASATAIYGARGANGVVIITTKGGREGRTTVQYNALIGVRQLANRLEVMNPYDFVRYQYQRSRGNATLENNYLRDYGHFSDMELYKGVPMVDWQDEVFGRSAMMQTHNVSVSGGTQQSSFNLSISSNKEEGIMLMSDFDRKLVNFRFDHNVSKRVKTGFNVRYNNTVVNGAGTSTPGSSSVNRLRHAIKYRPYLSPGEDLESYDPEYAEETSANGLFLVNPILLTKAEYRKSTRNLANLNTYVNFKFTDYLSFRSTVGVDLSRELIHVFNDSITAVSRANGESMPMASITNRDRNIFNNSNVLNFQADKLISSFKGRHKLDFMLGHEILEQQNSFEFRDSRKFPQGITPEMAFGSFQLGTPFIPRTEVFTSRLVSFFGRANLNLKDTYLFTTTFRYDGSSKFAIGNKWASFPSASAAWRFSNEGFMEGLKSVVNDAKLRVSYGTSGNNRIDDFLYLSQFEANQFYSIANRQEIGFGPRALANDGLVWETTQAANIGLDLTFLEGKINFSVDAFKNVTSDLLVNVPVPSTSGYTSQVQNVGATEGRGIEFMISATPVAARDFRWTTDFNISFIKNTVKSLGLQDEFLFRSGWAGSNQPFDYAVIVGRPVGTIWGLKTDGFYQISDFNYDANAGTYTLRADVPSNQSITATVPQPGMLKFKDENGDGVIDDDDRTIIGDANPKFFGGFNQMFSYKNWDMSIFVNFQYGNDILNANKLEFTSGYTINSNLLSMMNNRWSNIGPEGEVVTDPTVLAEMNQNATIWSPLTSASSFYVHDWAVEDGSFLRINNVTLGYTLPKSKFGKSGLSSLRVYGTVNNLAVFSKYSGYDPEVSTRRGSGLTPGVDYAAYPRSRAYIVGLNVTF
jgi:TonB-dependent starch-binding outer membrane protein SusC